MAATSTTTAAALVFSAIIALTVVASTAERNFNGGLYDLSNRDPPAQKRFIGGYYNSVRRYKDRRVKRFPVGLYYSLMGEDLTNPRKRPDYDDSEAY
ncbi:hypothetical protein GCK32_002202 [Trichostrongylus colubriformis]|uniref:Uncharacterized protein n=1 Tax=Trichostrongylus colubriformis TaxID=6319 RepID=A0AAN8FD57_TRICO